jgi:very-short-patch-repair endonuclease
MPRDLRLYPFRGSTSNLTPAQLRGSAWRRLFPDVYLAADVPVTQTLLGHAAVCYASPAWIGRVAVSGLSAMRVMGLDLLPPDAPVELTVPRSAHLRSRPGLTVVRRDLDATDVFHRDRLPVTTPVRTAFDVARRLDRVEAVVALDAMAHRKLVYLDDVASYANRALNAHGRHQVDAAVALAEPRSESPMETRLRLRIVDAGLPRPVAQHEVYRDGRFVGRLDLAYPDQRIGIEYEGDHHRDRDRFRQDIARLNALRVAGWSVIRATADDVRDPSRFVAQVRALLAS